MCVCVEEHGKMKEEKTKNEPIRIPDAGQVVLMEGRKDKDCDHSKYFFERKLCFCLARTNKLSQSDRKDIYNIKKIYFRYSKCCSLGFSSFIFTCSKINIIYKI